MKRVLKSKRAWLESQGESGSYYSLNVSTDGWQKGETSLTLADCNRTITWYFGMPGSKRAKRKIAKVKELIDSVYEHLHSKDKQP